MTFSDVFRSFFGLNRFDPSSNGNEGFNNNFRNPIWNVDDDDDDTEDELYHGHRSSGNVFPGESFNVFSDPLEMARYAENQMERMMSLFSSMMDQQFGKDFAQPPSIPFPSGPSMPAIEGKNGSSIRDEYLKPGYQKQLNTNKIDSDLDNKISEKNLDSLLDNIGKYQMDEPSTEIDRIALKNPQFHNNVFFKQIITKSFTRSDGTVETTRTVKNGDGTEETTTIISHNDNGHIPTEYDLHGRDRIRPFGEGFWNNFFGGF